MKPASNQDYDPPALPMIEDAWDFTIKEHPEPAELIHGVLHRGCKFAIGGGSKTQKTWLLMDMALSVSHHEPWLSLKTEKAAVCYVNLELPQWSFHKRLEAIRKDKQIKLGADNLFIWNLRGHSASYRTLLPRITEELRSRNLGLIIIDPIYKLYGDTDENSARDVAALLNELERLAQETGAAIVFAAHFSKGAQAGKESIDRISGSGCFARDPDTIVTLTRHETDGAFTVDATLRNHPPMQPFVVRWQYPLMRRTDDLDPAKIKQPNRGGGSAKTFTVEMLTDCLGKRKMNTAAFQKRCRDEIDMTRATFYRLFNEAVTAGKIVKDQKGKCEVSTGLNESVDTTQPSQSHSPLRSETD